MMSKARLAGYALAGVVILGGSPASASELGLAAGTKQVGGQVSLELVHSTAAYGATGYRVFLAPGIGYFVADGLEIRVGLGLDVWLGGIRENATGSLFGDIGIRWFADVGWYVVPYIGAAAGPAFVFTNTDDAAVTLAFAVPAGVLVPFNRYVALDLGARAELDVGVRHTAGSELHVVLGYFGVQAFF